VRDTINRFEILISVALVGGIVGSATRTSAITGARIAGEVLVLVLSVTEGIVGVFLGETILTGFLSRCAIALPHTSYISLFGSQIASHRIFLIQPKFSY